MYVDNMEIHLGYHFGHASITACMVPLVSVMSLYNGSLYATHKFFSSSYPTNYRKTIQRAIQPLN